MFRCSRWRPSYVGIEDAAAAKSLDKARSGGWVVANQGAIVIDLNTLANLAIVVLGDFRSGRDFCDMGENHNAWSKGARECGEAW